MVALLLAGLACERGAGDPLVDPPVSPSGLHTSLDGLRELPDAALTARLGQRGLADLTYAELSAMTDSQRQTLTYVARCALEPGAKVEVSMGAGAGYVLEGALGLAPELRTGACESGCQELLTGCLLAHVNSRGIHVPLWLTAGTPVTGRSTSSSYPIEEATFFGNLWAPGATAAYCKAPTASDGVVPGRIGVLPGQGAPYEDLLADKYYRDADGLHAGTCAACTRSASGDVEACALDGVTFTRPLTVWRSRTYQAEAATLTGGARINGSVDRVVNVRVSWMNPGAAVAFDGVVSARAGSNTLAFYGSNGDPIGSPERKLAISINGSPTRVESFAATGRGWGDATLHALTFDGFLEGANTITFTVPADASGPDLDWLEVVPAL